MKNLDVNAAKWVKMYFRYSSSCSSSWERLCREFTFHSEFVHAVIETVDSCSREADHGSERNYRYPATDWQQLVWQRTTLFIDKAVHFAIAKNLRLFRFSVVYGRYQASDSASAWKVKIDWFLNLRQIRELDRIDGEPIEFEWNIFQVFIQKMMAEITCELEYFQERRIIFM